MSGAASGIETLEAGRREWWVWFAYGIGATCAAVFLYLGLRPGGMGPVLAYVYGRTLLFLLSALVLVLGLFLSLLRRPVLQRGRLGGFLALGATVWFSAYPLAYPSSHEKAPSATTFRLPFEGEWTTRWGGSKGPQNALVLHPDRRFGFDFLRCDSEGRSGDGRRSLCRGSSVLAPAAGEVVAVHDGEPDAPFGEYPGGEEPYGNHVILRVAEGEYLFLIGLEEGSVSVGEGDTVGPGDFVGRVGFTSRSALTPEAHLGVHLQDTPRLRRGEGIPMRFEGYLRGDRTVERGTPQGGYRGGLNVGERVTAAASR